jgi:hypothetical protein
MIHNGLIIFYFTRNQKEMTINILSNKMSFMDQPFKDTLSGEAQKKIVIRKYQLPKKDNNLQKI